jgi:2-polyprenyl-6-methoxyphenol hydroxylase-like FAD-dependent oxidoreductase
VLLNVVSFVKARWCTPVFVAIGDAAHAIATTCG